MVKIAKETKFTWKRKFGKKFLVQFERQEEVKNGPIYKVHVGNTYEFDKKNDLFDISKEFYAPLSEYDFSDRIKGKKGNEKTKELIETKFRFIFFNYSFRDFNVTFNGETKMIKRYNNEAFYSDEKEEKKIIIEHNCNDLTLKFEYTIKSWFSYTFDSSFNLIQNNNEQLLKENFLNVSNEEILKIINEGNSGN